MAHTWKFAIGLGLLSAALVGACTVKEGDDDDTSGAGGEANGGSGGTTGGSAGKGGTSNAGKGGTTGGSAGKGGSAGSGTGGTTGGSAGSGTGGTTGGTGAVGGSDAGAAGAGDTGGTGGGTDTTPTCDPDSGELDSTPFPNCDADPSTDPCQVCIQEHCCEESKTCYGMEPYNVCGWGGPTDGEYKGHNEIGCFQLCLSAAVEANEMTCTTDDADTCIAECATPMCGLFGNATNVLAGCMQDSCASECFGADTCGD